MLAEAGGRGDGRGLQSGVRRAAGKASLAARGPCGCRGRQGVEVEKHSLSLTLPIHKEALAAAQRAPGLH